MSRGINVGNLRDHVIRPALESIGLYSLAAEQLLLGTAAVESEMGRWLAQVRGPALGIFQMEPPTHDDIVSRWLMARDDLYRRTTTAIGSGHFRAERLAYDLRYAAILCRLHYRRRPEPLPPAGDWGAMAAYWKRHYNTVAGRGTPEKFLIAVNLYGLQP